MMAKKKDKVKGASDQIDFGKELGPKKTAAPMEKLKKKKKFGLKLKIILLAVLLLAAVAAAGIIYMKLSVQGSVTDYLRKFDPGYQSLLAENKDMKSEIEVLNALLDENESQSQETQAQLAKPETTPESEENTDSEEEKTDSEDDNSTEESYEEFVSGLSEEKLAQMEQIGLIYSKMDAAKAAAVLSEVYDENYISIILYYMKPDVSAAVLSNLDATLAARITENLVG